MISKNCGRRRSAKGLKKYITAKMKEAEFVCGSVSDADFTSELEIRASLRPDVERPFDHFSLRLGKEEGDLPTWKWVLIVARYLALMDLKDPLYAAWRHPRTKDGDGDHVHIALCRVMADGALWDGQFEAYRGIEAAATVAAEFGLVVVRFEAKKAPKRGEFELSQKRGEYTPRLKLRALVNACLDSSDDFEEFADALSFYGIHSRANIQPNGLVRGLSFRLDDYCAKGSELGLPWAKISKILNYDKEKHDRILEQFGARTGDEQFEGPIEAGECDEGIAVRARSDSGEVGPKTETNSRSDGRFGEYAEDSHRVLEKIFGLGDEGNRFFEEDDSGDFERVREGQSGAAENTLQGFDADEQTAGEGIRDDEVRGSGGVERDRKVVGREVGPSENRRREELEPPMEVRAEIGSGDIDDQDETGSNRESLDQGLLGIRRAVVADAESDRKKASEKLDEDLRERATLPPLRVVDDSNLGRDAGKKRKRNDRRSTRDANEAETFPGI
ncbi:hypothetical protein IEN85_19320 [Pelagicoccus sp. NFK12]|uniref:MobA/VirD2-like nuclease domain-containing protein n=1 Tax=Pelagicoccus enzymogenes TaxID=2773457 RepID=A0A927FC58_9BACT|nr:hypothetical protein [Pelagicoccus enzymogenes]MBD5781660.1 hypothetical protein [Pelagicoccus enzymogenes]